MKKNLNMHDFIIKFNFFTKIEMRTRVQIFLLIMLSFSFSNCKHNASSAEKLIKNLIVNKNKITIEINDWFRKQFLKNNFFAEYDEDIDLTKVDESLVTIPFILNVISLVWHSGRIYSLDCLDEDLYLSLKKIKIILQKMYPDVTWEGELIPKKLKKNEIDWQINKNNIALPFTGGVDSTYSSLKNRDKKQLLITIFDGPAANDKNRNRITKDLTSFAQTFGHKNSFIKSNFITFLNHSIIDNLSPQIPVWRTGAIEDLGWIGLCAPILILKKIPILYISSSFTFSYEYPTLGNPFIDQNLKYANFSAQHHDFFNTRSAKVEYLLNLFKAGLIPSLKFNVCGVENCCKCEKCLRTINNILANNEDYKNFGFNTNEQEILQNMQTLFKTPFRQPLLYFFKDIQNKFKELINKKITDKQRAYANWFLGIDFEKFLSDKEGSRKKIDWSQLRRELEKEEIFAN